MKQKRTDSIIVGSNQNSFYIPRTESQVQVQKLGLQHQCSDNQFQNSFMHETNEIAAPERTMEQIQENLFDEGKEHDDSREYFNFASGL